MKTVPVIVCCAALVACGNRVASRLAIESSSNALNVGDVSIPVSLQTPKGMEPTAFAIAATQGVSVGAGAKILRLGGHLSSISNVGPGGVEAQPDAVLGDVWSTSNVALRDRVHVLGTVHSPAVTRGNSVRIDKGIDSTTSLAPANVMSWTVTYPAGSIVNVILQPGQSASKPPGRYGVVSVASRATLTLAAGTYFLDSLDLEPSAKISLSQDGGPVIVYVRTSLIFRGAIGATAAGVAPDILLG